MPSLPCTFTGTPAIWTPFDLARSKDLETIEDCAGTCLVTDWQENFDDFFVIDEQVVAHRDADECAEKIKYLLDNKESRASIAKAGQAGTLKEHSFEKTGKEVCRFP